MLSFPCSLHTAVFPCSLLPKHYSVPLFATPYTLQCSLDCYSLHTTVYPCSLLPTHHAVGGEVLVLVVEVEGMLVVQADVPKTLNKQLLTVGDPL